VQQGVDVRRGGGDLVGGGRVGAQVALGEADRSHVQADPVGGGGGAEHQLGGAAADVDHQRGSGGQALDGADRAAVGQLRLLLAGGDLGVDAEDRADAGDEVLAVGGVAGRGGGHEADVLAAHAVVLHQRVVSAGGVQRALDGDGVEAPGAVHAEPEADHLQVPLEVDEAPGGLVAPGDQQADRVGAAVDR